ncbi:hypothetical protein T492DRAFT_840884 [Pavlovales sp. CCMP2436]|nr:hypothetical protein T492DRAFT_840884 [Pavlovales sp. CCMP2436]
MPRKDGPLRLTDLLTEALESVLVLTAPLDIASALRSCRALSRLNPWRSAFEARWGASGVELRASVGKMAYLLRDVCELVSGGLALAKARHRTSQDTLEATMELEENRPCRARALREVGEAFAQCATSVASARVLLAALTQGLYVLLDRTNNGSLTDDWYVKNFVLASPRGDLVAFHSSVVGAYYGDTRGSRKWELYATVIGLADEQRLAEAMRGSLGLRGQKLLEWFDGLFLGGDQQIVVNAEPPTPASGCGELLRLVGCEASVWPGILLRIEPPLSPAVVGSLLDSLGLGEGRCTPTTCCSRYSLSPTWFLPAGSPRSGSRRLMTLGGRTTTIAFGYTQASACGARAAAPPPPTTLTSASNGETERPLA